MLPSRMRNRALTELEGDVPKPKESTYLLATTYRLRHVPLREFSAEDLRIMIDQHIGLIYLVPLALERLQRHSLAHGDYFPGDLLVATLPADQKFWRWAEHGCEGSVPRLIDSGSYNVEAQLSSPGRI